MTATLVVREMRNDGKQEVYILDAENWTLKEFQMWLFGLHMDGTNMLYGSERNEILGYYPNVEHAQDQDFEGVNPLDNPHHRMWADPDGMPSRYAEDD